MSFNGIIAVTYKISAAPLIDFYPGVGGNITGLEPGRFAGTFLLLSHFPVQNLGYRVSILLPRQDRSQINRESIGIIQFEYLRLRDQVFFRFLQICFYSLENIQTTVKSRLKMLSSAWHNV